MFKRALAVVTIAACMGIAPAAPDNAFTATSFSSVKMAVVPGDTFGIECDDFTGGRDAAVLVQYVLTSLYDTVTRGLGVAQFIEEGVTLRVRADATTHEETIDPGSAHDSIVPGYAGTVRYGERWLRVVWASWNAPHSCRVTLNGQPVSPTTGDPTRAAMATAARFNGGAAVEGPLFGAAVQGTYEREAHGFVFSWMLADGLATSRAPGGANAGNSQTFYAARANGLFTYSFGAAVRVPTPRVFLLEVPV